MPRCFSVIGFISVFGWGVFNIVVGLTVLFVKQQVDISTTVEGFQERGDDMMTYQFSTSDIITTPHEPSSGSSQQFPQDSPPSPPPPPFPSPPPYHFTQDQTPDSTPQVKLFLQSITLFICFPDICTCVYRCVSQCHCVPSTVFWFQQVCQVFRSGWKYCYDVTECFVLFSCRWNAV